MTSDYKFYVYVIKNATYLAIELKEKAKRIELEKDGILPASKFILSKLDLSRDSFIYKYGSRSLILSLYTGLLTANHDDEMKDAIDELATTTFQLTDYMVPLKAAPIVKGATPNFMEAYLVRESCIIKCPRMDNANFTFTGPDLKYKTLMESVIEMIGCLHTINVILIEKERELRIKRFMRNILKRQEAMNLNRNGDEDYDSDNSDDYPLLPMTTPETPVADECEMETEDKQEQEKGKKQEEENEEATQGQ